MKTYAYKNVESEVLKSSSGGAFIKLCQVFEKIYGRENISFYGATFDDKLNIVHKRVNTADECECFQGSKYVKSQMKTF